MRINEIPTDDFFNSRINRDIIRVRAGQNCEKNWGVAKNAAAVGLLLNSQ